MLNRVTMTTYSYYARMTQQLQPTTPFSTPVHIHDLQYVQQNTFNTTNGSLHSTTSTTSKHKLPHGLTVYELKEMTKARLQSEAAEKSNGRNEVQEICRDRVSPLDFDSGDQVRDRTFSRDSSLSSRMNNNPVEFYPQNQQFAPNATQVQGQPQSQLLNSGLHPVPSMLGGGAAPSSFRTTRSRTDTWESTSVASHNSTIHSENLSSESTSEVGSFSHSGHRNRAFTCPAVQPDKPLDAMSNTTSGLYNDSRSFSSPSPVQASPRRGPGMIGGTSLFNAAVGGNRCRAVTLSPNTDSILEDRPFHYDAFESGDRLEIPNFSGGISGATTLSAATPSQTRQRDYSPVLEQLGLDSSYLSNGTDSNSVFRSLATSSMSPLQGITQTGSRELDSLNEFQPITKNKSDIFSEQAIETRIAAPPPGFVTASSSPIGNTAFSIVGSLDGYSNINRSHLLSEDNVLSDFGSLLDLSGPRDDRERANTYTFGSNEFRSMNDNQSGGH